MTDYNLGDIHTEVRDLIGATGANSLVSDVIINRTINRVARAFAEETKCNYNMIIITIPDADSSADVSEDINGTGTLVILDELADWNSYVITNCEIIDSIDRWITSGDGFRTELDYFDQNWIDTGDLLFDNSTKPTGVEILDYNRFRILPSLSSGAYPLRLKIVYRMTSDPMENDSDNPTIPHRFRIAIVYGTVSELARGDKMGDPGLAAQWEPPFREIRDRARKETKKFLKMNRARIKNRYQALGDAGSS